MIEINTKASYTAAPEALKICSNSGAETGETVHWLADGYIYEYPSGKKLFGMIGFYSTIFFDSKTLTARLNI
ncbi:hypothetical protein [Aquimarina sp. RZ0]|uniref:hypothetical protein n=1 Tax=Aquimarina sp. RZ0 TaxID=2607730 RepID=UPI0011F350F9|nr:hypothetical protein [Aquimarina sp. RZ0]KAA1244931.1 hypothetical protein F0000_14415 [Aquimarina sp. RZ0]